MPMPQLLRDLALLVARLGLGVVLVAHGWQKVVDQGLGGTARRFADWGVPVPTLSAYYATIVELLGGVALILGLTVSIVGVLIAVDMAGAIAFVHIGNGILLGNSGSVGRDGFELVLTIGVAALLLAAFGSGRISLDNLYAGNRRARRGRSARASA